MDEQTTWDLGALKNYIAALEEFKSNIEKSCDDLEGGINSCQTFMKDTVSQSALSKGKQVALDIKACLNPIQMRLEKLREIEMTMTQAPQYEM